MEPVERSGKNPEEILKALSREWECLPEDIKHEVVQEGARGVMGIGAKDYVLKAWPPSNATLQPPPRPAASEK
ncbi:MAG: Jag N-terminal domain-containing protein, partial [Bdellovibrionota bacterium]